MSRSARHQSNTSGNTPWHVEQQALYRVYAEQIRRLKAGRSAGGRRHILQRDFFRDQKVKQAAILKATKGKLCRTQTFDLAEQVTPYAEQEYSVKTFPLNKGSGGTRPICVLPPVLAATQKIIKSALDAEFVRHPTMFGVKDHGRDKTAEHIQQLQREGYSDLWQTDIQDCFASFNLEALYDLPLPERIIRNVLDTRNNRFSFQAFPSKSEAMKGASPETPNALTPVNCLVQDQGDIGSSIVDTVCNTRGPQGLMQGSPASSAILAWHLNALLKDVPLSEDVQIIVCFDNLLIASRCSEENRMARSTLADSLGRCSFGPLTLHSPISSDPDQGMDFLGYNHPSGGSTIGIGHKARERLTHHLVALEREFENRQWVDPVSETYELWNTLLDFAGGYSSATDIEAEMAEFVETSAWIPEATSDPFLMHMHWRLFAPKPPSEEVFFGAVRGITRRYKIRR